MRALEKNEIWEIVVRPKEKKVVGCKWVYIVKFKADGTTERYKARLAAKRLHTNLWGGLPRDFCTHDKDEHNKNSIISSNTFWLENPAI